MAAAFAESYWSTRFGPGITNTDSACYIHAAKTFIQQGTMLMPDRHGGLEPLHLWPPMYPLFLVAAHWATGNLLTAARVLNLLLFPLNVLLVTLLAARLKVPRLGRAVVGFFFLMAPVILWAHVMVMSESTALFFWLLGLWCLMRYAEAQSWRILLASALVAAATVLSRYMGIAQIGAGIWFVLIYTQGSWARKLARVAVYAMVAVAPLLVWILSRPSTSLLNATGRKLGYYGISRVQALSALGAYARWLVPYDGHSLLKLLFLVVIVVLALAAAFFARRTIGKMTLPRDGGGRNHAPVILLLLNIAACEGLILVAGLFLDRTLDMSERMHVFTFVMVLLLAAAGGTAWSRSAVAQRSAPARCCAIALLALLLLGYLGGGLFWLATAAEQHLGFNTTAWRNSPGLALLEKRYANLPLYINYFGPIYFRTGQLDIRYVPQTSDGLRRAANPQLDRDLQTMVADLSARHGVILYFKELEPNDLPVDQLKSVSGLQVVDETADAVFLRANADAKK